MAQNKYLFVFSHNDQIRWYKVFAESFKEASVDNKVVIFVHGQQDVLIAKQHDCYDVIINLIDDFQFNSKVKMDELQVHPEILSLECNGSYFFWEDIKKDRWARAEGNTSFMMQYLNHAVSIITEKYEMFSPIAALGEYTSSIYCFVQRFFQKAGKPMFYPITTRYFERFYFETDLRWAWQKCIEYYGNYIKGEVPTDTLIKIKPIYERISQKNAKPSYTEYQNQYPVGFTEIHKLNYAQIYQKLRHFFIKTRREDNNIRHALLETKLSTKLKRFIRERFNLNVYKTLVTHKLPEISFCVYFLHYQPEYTSESLGHFYIDQQYLIRNIASSLPANMYLIVKEHPTMVGLRDKSIYKQIVSIANVILIDHAYDSFKLITNSKIVFTIVGTPALEGMFIGKPSIMFGKYAFANTNLISLCDNLWLLPEMIKRKLELNLEESEIKKHAVALLSAKHDASYPGKIPIAVELIEPFLSNGSNYDLVKAAFKKELLDRGLI